MSYELKIIVKVYLIAEHNLGYDFLFFNESVNPVSGILGVVTVVAKHKITAFRNNISICFTIIKDVILDIRFIKLITVDIYSSTFYLYNIVWKTDYTFDIILGFVIWKLEYDYISTFRF